MSRIGSTIHSFEQFLLTQLARSNQAVNASSFRLATGKKVTSPSDDPSAYVTIRSLETHLSRLQGLQANADAALNIGANAQTSLDQIRTKLNSIRTNLVADEDNLLTSAQKTANQALNDAEIAAIRVLARTTVHGKRFLDGSHDYTTSGRNPSQVKNVDVFALTDDITISGTVTSAATQSTSRYTGLLGNINSGNATFTLRGKRGNTSISVVNGEALTAVRDRINLDSHLTGITASVSGSNLDFTTVDYGSTATISVTVTAGTFNTSTITTGANAAVTINGTAVAAARIDGNRVSYISSGVHAVLELAAGFTGAFTSFTVSDDQVARFSVSTRVSERIKLGVPGVFPETLGGVSGLVSALETGGSLAGLGTNTQQAIRVIDEALAQLSTVEARVDAFTDIAITSADSLLAELASKTEDALDTLNTVDEEAEELVRSRHQALSENAIAAIAIMQQQQSSMLAMLRQLAGLD